MIDQPTTSLSYGLDDNQYLLDGDRVALFPNPDNPLHKKPVKATYSGGYFYCDDSPPGDGPDYYFGDVLKHNRIEKIEEEK